MTHTNQPHPPAGRPTPGTTRPGAVRRAVDEIRRGWHDLNYLNERMLGPDLPWD